MKTVKLSSLVLCVALSACGSGDSTSTSEPITTAPLQAAPGAPGTPSVWVNSAKNGIGTSYEQYLDGQYSDSAATGTVSKVWFSLAHGIITETMFGLIHEAQLKEMQFSFAGGNFVDFERGDTNTQIDYLATDENGRPLSLAYKVTNQDKEGKYAIEKHIFTDPDSQTLFVRAIITALTEDITPRLHVNPHINNNGSNDKATVSTTQLMAYDDNVYMSVIPSQPFIRASAGFVGVSDGITDLEDNDQMDWQYATTGTVGGNVALTGELGTIKAGTSQRIDFALGFGHSQDQSNTAAQNSLQRGYAAVLAHYNGEGAHIGWQDYLTSLTALPSLQAASTDDGKLLYASALVLKAQEDKTHAGALIASLSNPWGDTVSADSGQTGYKAVWPRDFYQCSMALLALGDHQTPRVAFEYLQKVQVRQSTPENQGDSGWFLQKTHVDGQIEWVGVQLDQTAMPIMLGWKLWQADILSDQEITYWYQDMLKPAAEFLVNGGHAKIDWNDTTIIPPITQQERWEEQAGYSPSTTAAVIAGLITAADIAKHAGDTEAATSFMNTANSYSDSLESKMYTTTGNLGDGQYFLRISPNGDPNSNTPLLDNNGRPGLDQRAILDGGFLELVRYGVRSANDEHILNTLPEYDNETVEENLKVRYSFTFDNVDGSYPGYRRYGNDGYGEDEITGGNYAENGSNTAGQRGRVWPFFTGERGHYEVAAMKEASMDAATRQAKIQSIRDTYVKGMELFANEGLMLPEQVWDGVGNNDRYQYRMGQGTNSATPLAWTHAEYIKLLRSVRDQRVWDHYPVVSEQLQR